MQQDENKPRKARVRTIPFAAWHLLEQYAMQTVAHLRTGKAADKPNPALLVDAVRQWPRHAKLSPVAVHDDMGTAIRLLFAKPKDAESTSHRDIDPEALGVLLLAFVAGGHIVLEPHGSHDEFYYLRVYIDGYQTDGKLRRVHGLRILAETSVGTHTVEPKGDYHDLRRCNLGEFRSPRSSEPVAIYGAKDFRDFALARFREVSIEAPASLPEGLDETRYSALLDAAFGALRAIPLGLASAEAAE